MLRLDRKPQVRREWEAGIALRPQQSARPEVLNLADMMLPIRNAYLEYWGKQRILLCPPIKAPHAQADGLLVRTDLSRHRIF